MNIEGARIVITGAGRGLGQAIARHLSGHGARLALLDIDGGAAAETAADCASNAMEVFTAACDVSREDAVTEAFDHAASALGGIDALVANAGILRDGLLVKAREGEVIDRMSLADWQEVIDVNLTGVFLCGREAATHMIRQGTGGCIVNISSIARAGNFGQSNYAAAKAGVAAMTVTWAQELARHRIRNMAIAPGFIETAMTDSMKPEALQRMVERVPAGRAGHPDEVALTVAQVLENDYLNGRVLELDGGLRI
ncbi:SDR family oxidoreductase [Marinihelvus fidelis]|uniref:SDR family oxidoreductase n=1 Tax=Marinihelvus fidelis TaxID=2613842 RepID=A0A5N0TFW4_9GAMM|nr:SDR family NAD(P)-dependent oxidoreductase [Marinihelvus fidelis]KAA9132766.1 SDR family oxidoreductase [Marinihelvus fidelis]